MSAPPADLFDLVEGDSPLIVSMPHSGTQLAFDLDKRLSSEALVLPDTDWHLPELYNVLDGFSPSRITARYSRYVVDLNRDPEDRRLYPDRAVTGLVPDHSFEAGALYLIDQEPDETEIKQRIARYHAPYHAALHGLIDRVKARHGHAVLWDAHSIVCEPAAAGRDRIPDLCLGTHIGASCAPEIRQAAVSALRQAEGFSFVADGVFQGGYITRHYGRPATSVHALQMELAQIIYMDEHPHWRFDEARAAKLRPVLQSVIEAALDAARALHDGANQGERG